MPIVPTALGVRPVVRLPPVLPVLQRPRNVPRELSSLDVVMTTVGPCLPRLTVARMLALRFAALGRPGYSRVGPMIVAKASINSFHSRRESRKIEM